MKKSLYSKMAVLLLVFMGSLQAQAADVFTLVSSKPANGGLWEKPNPYVTNLNVSFSLTFGEEVLITNETPDGISLVKNNDGEVPLPTGGSWKLAVDANNPNRVIVKMVTDDGYTHAIYPSDSKYTLTIPAGLIMNGDMTAENETIILSFYDSQKAFEEGTLVKPVSTTPAADGAFVLTDGKAAAAITLTFDHDVLISNANPEVALLKGAEDGESVTECSWQARFGDDNKTVVVEAVASDESVVTFTPEETSYYFILPEKFIADEDGRYNPASAIRVWSTEEAKYAAFPHLVSSVPAAGDALPLNDAGQFEVAFTLQFDKAVKMQKASAISMREGSADGNKVQTGNSDWGMNSWIATMQDDGVTMSLSYNFFGTVETFTPKEDTKYYLVIPAATLVSVEGNLPNEEIVIEFNGPVTTGIDAVDAAASAATRFTLGGAQAAPGTKGVVIIRTADGKMRKEMKR